MPNTRRRRFSVHNEIAARNSSKMQNGLQSSHTENDSSNSIPILPSKWKNKVYPNSSKNSGPLEIVAEHESTTSMATVKKKSMITMDKDVTASSSTIDLFNIIVQDDIPPNDEEANEVLMEDNKNNESQPEVPIKTPPRKEKHQREHRAKVRSPRRRIVLQEPSKVIDTKCTTGTIAIDWNEELNLSVVEAVTNESGCEENRQSSNSFDDMCRICHGGESLSPELGRLISACSCRGTVGRVHVKCLERWLTESGKSRCELCGTRYVTKRVHRYGVPRALMMWVLSQNAKQLMVDSLGIMLMSPLAVLAAWLSGRTLAGLMTQDTHVTPWPLASTFVLACMTLVCYYCWIVSAATRHALGWWIWYRSQYEVRLQLQDSVDED